MADRPPALVLAMGEGGRGGGGGGTPPAGGPLLLADISGYTGFLQDVAHAHRDDAFAGGQVPDAYGLVSSLLDGIIQKTVPPFTLAKIEGDAAFAFARAADEA